MTTETMREAVARAICRELTGGWQASPKSIDRKAADAAIRTVLERLREPTSAMMEAGSGARDPRKSLEENTIATFRAMLDAAAREVG